MWKSWLPIAISALALVVSVTNLFSSAFLQRDHIRVVPGGRPTLMRYDKESFGSGIDTLTFINSGNRGAVIQDLAVLVSNADREEGPVCTKQLGPTFLVKYRHEPILIKPGDIVIVHLDENTAKRVEQTDDRNRTGFKPGDLAVACIGLSVLMPNSDVERVRFEVLRHTVEPTWQGFNPGRMPDMVLTRANLQILAWSISLY